MRSLGRYALTEEAIFEEFANHLLGAPSRFLQLARSSGAAA
jgi:hypothetical protein